VQAQIARIGDEQRVTRRRLRQITGARFIRAAAPEVMQSQRAGILDGQRTERHAFDGEWKRDRGSRTARADQEQRRRPGRTDHVGQQHQAIDIAPLQIVDDQDQRRAALREPPEQAAQGGIHPPPALDRIEWFSPRLRGRWLFRDSKHHRKRIGQKRDVDGEDPVEGVVRNRFALVAASGEHDGTGAGCLFGEAAHERGLSHARFAFDEDRDGTAIRRGERRAQSSELGAPADKRRRGRRRDRCADPLAGARRSPGASADVLGRGACRRLVTQERETQGLQIIRNAGRAHRRRWRIHGRQVAGKALIADPWLHPDSTSRPPIQNRAAPRVRHPRPGCWTV